MTTWSTLRTNIRAELRESVEGFWTNAELLRWANRGLSKMQRRARVEATAALTLIAGTDNYSLPTDFFLARRIELGTSGSASANWTEVQHVDLDLRIAGDPSSGVGIQAFPFGYYVFNGLLYFTPPPDQAYSGTLYYYKNKTALSADSDALVYPEGVDTDDYDEALEWYVCAQALRKRQDPAYTTYLSDFAAANDVIGGDAAQRGSSGDLIVHDDWRGE